MKFIILLTIIFTLIVVNRGAVMQGAFKDLNHPGKCVYSGLILSPGETAQKPNGCARIMCAKDSWVTVHTCGTILPPKGHKLGDRINPQADYPDCCKRAYVPIL